MRFLYVDPNTPEHRARVALEAQFDQFWSAFRDAVAAAPDAKKSSDWIIALMRERLPMNGTGIEWEAGPDASGDMKLVITAAGERGLRPAVDRLVALAPAIDGWSFVAYRQPEPAEVAAMLLDGRTGNRGYTVDAPTFRVSDAPNNLLAIECFATNATAEPRSRGCAMLLAEILVGEQAFESWVGPFDHAPAPRRGLLRRPTPPADAVAPGELRGVVDRMIGERVARLPDRPRSALTDEEWAAHGAVVGPDEWQAYEMRPADARADGDWPSQADQVFATVREPALFTGTRGAAFDSRRFSRVAERFAYLKIEHDDVWPREELLDRREALYESLDRSLRDARAGCGWGIASGVRYLYVELALADVDAAIPLIRARAAGAGVGPRSWLLFHDADLCDEWVGLTPDAPAPPREADAGA